MFLRVILSIKIVLLLCYICILLGLNYGNNVLAVSFGIVITILFGCGTAANMVLQRCMLILDSGKICKKSETKPFIHKLQPPTGKSPHDDMWQHALHHHLYHRTGHAIDQNCQNVNVIEKFAPQLAFSIIQTWQSIIIMQLQKPTRLRVCSNHNPECLCLGACVCYTRWIARPRLLVLCWLVSQWWKCIYNAQTSPNGSWMRCPHSSAQFWFEM